jgi:hypothetical protein
MEKNLAPPQNSKNRKRDGLQRKNRQERVSAPSVPTVGVRALLKVANSVPIEGLEPLEKIVDRAVLPAGRTSTQIRWELERTVERKGATIIELIGPINSRTLHIAAENYEIVRIIADTLRSVAAQRGPYVPGSADQLLMSEIRAQGRAKDYLRELRALATGPLADRVRACDRPNCRRLFYATRTDRLYCSDACSSALRNSALRKRRGPRKG